MNTPDFAGAPVVCFEARRSAEMSSLVERHGGTPVPAPALREVRTPPSPETLAFAADLESGLLDLLILLTGVGTRALVDEVADVLPRDRFIAALARMRDAEGRSRVVARGPKPAAVLREMGIAGFVQVPSPNTYRELLATLDAEIGARLAGMRVAVQEYGVANEALYEGLRARGAHVTPVRVYTWALPEDTTKLREALHALSRGEIRIALFTTRAQVENILLVAAEEGIEAEVRAALGRAFVGSIGPVCTEALRAESIVPDVEANPPKMGHLVRESAARSAEALAKKGR